MEDSEGKLLIISNLSYNKTGQIRPYHISVGENPIYVWCQQEMCRVRAQAQWVPWIILPLMTAKPW